MSGGADFVSLGHMSRIVETLILKNFSTGFIIGTVMKKKRGGFQLSMLSTAVCSDPDSETVGIKMFPIIFCPTNLKKKKKKDKKREMHHHTANPK